MIKKVSQIKNELGETRANTSGTSAESQAVSTTSQATLKEINKGADSKEEIKAAVTYTASPAENEAEVQLTEETPPLEIVSEEKKTQSIFRRFFCCGK